MAAGEAASRAEALADAVAAGDRVPRPLQLPGAPLGIARFDVVAGAQDLDLGFLPSGFPPDEVATGAATEREEDAGGGGQMLRRGWGPVLSCAATGSIGNDW